MSELFGRTNAISDLWPALRMEDVRNAVEAAGPAPDKIGLVRVSDEWWVLLQNGEPVGKYQHPTVMRLAGKMALEAPR